MIIVGAELFFKGDEVLIGGSCDRYHKVLPGGLAAIVRCVEAVTPQPRILLRALTRDDKAP
jgi:hypothetical protein